MKPRKRSCRQAGGTIRSAPSGIPTSGRPATSKRNTPRNWQNSSQASWLQWASNGLNTIFCLWTFAGSVFVLFLSELGLPKAHIGVVLSLFPFCGLLALGFAPLAVRLGRKRVFLACFGARKCVMAGLLLLPLITNSFGRGVDGRPNSWIR